MSDYIGHRGDVENATYAGYQMTPKCMENKFIAYAKNFGLFIHLHTMDNISEIAQGASVGATSPEDMQDDLQALRNKMKITFESKRKVVIMSRVHNFIREEYCMYFLRYKACSIYH